MNGDRTERLFQLQVEIARRRATGVAIAVTDLAAAFALTVEEVERSVAGVDGLALLEPEALPPPQLPEDYELLGELGRGGMGVVYRARQRSLDRVIAIKVLRSGDLRSDDVIQRFRREARSLARLRHPHIVPIHEVGEAGGLLYFTMDLIEGASLSQLIQQGAVTAGRTVHVLRQVVSAVAWSHAQGVVHRDLKPANILVDARGEAFVVDFGLARDAAAGEHTVSGQVFGTPAYMSPEQARGDGERIGERSDVYALGAVLYECLGGRAPFHGLALAEVVHAVLHDEPRSLRKLRPDVPRDLELICSKAMAKEPEHRYPTANALLDDLERFHDGRPVRARGPGLYYRSTRLLRRHGRALAIGSALAVALVTAFVAVVLPLVRPPAAATLRSARQLAARGEHAAALVLLEQAQAQVGARDVVDDLHQQEVASHLALVQKAIDGPVTGLVIAGESLARAAKAAIAMVADGSRRAVVAAAWELAARATAVDQAAVAETAMKAVDEIIAAQAVVAGGRLDLTGLVKLMWAPGTGDERDLTARLLPALLDERDQLHRVGVQFVGTRVVGPEPRPAIVAWLRGAAERDARVLRPLLRRLDGFPPEQREGLLGLLSVRGLDGALAPVLLQRAAQELLATVAADETLGPLSRSAAADLLARNTDLPLCLSVEYPSLVPQPDLARVDAILRLWREVKDLDGIAAFERRIAAAVDLPQLDDREVRQWLDRHTLGAPGEQGDCGTKAAWRQWWRANSQVDPRLRLCQGLGLASVPPPEDVPALLQRMLRASSRECSGLHQLLTLLVRERPGQPLPIQPWESWSESVPMQWWRLVHGSDPAPTYQLRLCAIAWRDGAAAPELAWEEQRLLRLDEVVVASTRKQPLPPLPARCASPRVPGFDTGIDVDAGTWHDVLPSFTVRWTRMRRVELCPSSRDPGFRAVSRAAVNSSSGSIPDIDEGTVSVLHEAVVPAWADGGRDGQRILCAFFQEGTAEPRPWGLAGWRQALADWLHRLPTGFWQGPDGAASCDHRRLFDAGHAIELAAHIPVPEARAELERLTANIPLHEPPGSDDWSRHVARARLLIGDGAPLRSSLSPALLPPAAADGRRADEDTRFWAHVLLGQADDTSRREALSRLRAASLSPAMARGIAARANLETALPDAVVRKAASAHPWRAWLAPEDVAVPSLLGLFVAVALVGYVAWRRCWRHRVTAADSAVLVAAGLVIVLFDVRVGGVPLLPDPLGWAVCAVGCWWSAPRSRARVGVAILFALAATIDLSPRTMPIILHLLATTLGGTALLLLPLLTNVGAQSWRWRALAAAGVLAFAVAVLPAWFDEWRVQLLMGMPAWSQWGPPAWAWTRQALPLCGLALILAHYLGRASARQRAAV